MPGKDTLMCLHLAWQMKSTAKCFGTQLEGIRRRQEKFITVSMAHDGSPVSMRHVIEANFSGA